MENSKLLSNDRNELQPNTGTEEQGQNTGTEEQIIKIDLSIVLSNQQDNGGYKSVDENFYNPGNNTSYFKGLIQHMKPRDQVHLLLDMVNHIKTASNRPTTRNKESYSFKSSEGILITKIERSYSFQS